MVHTTPNDATPHSDSAKSDGRDDVTDRQLSGDFSSDTNTFIYQLNELKRQGVHNFDPTRFRFIESLIYRAAAQRTNVRQGLELKAQQILDEYYLAMEASNVKPETALITPSSRELSSKGLLSDGLQSKNLSSKSLAEDVLTALSTLNQYLAESFLDEGLSAEPLPKEQSPDKLSSSNILSELDSSNNSSNNSSTDRFTGNATQSCLRSFEQQLKQQEQLIRRECDNVCVNMDNAPVNERDSNVPIMTVLKSSLAYQKFQKRTRVDHFIDIALGEIPETPGPLNPEMLAIRLLKSISTISPEYLSRYVSYFETLQYLDKAGS